MAQGVPTWWKRSRKLGGGSGHLICPGCGQRTGTAVIDSRVSPGDTVRRRRVCIECGFRYTTKERCALDDSEGYVDALRFTLKASDEEEVRPVTERDRLPMIEANRHLLNEPDHDWLIEELKHTRQLLKGCVEALGLMAARTEEGNREREVLNRRLEAAERERDKLKTLVGNLRQYVVYVQDGMCSVEAQQAALDSIAEATGR